MTIFFIFSSEITIPLICIVRSGMTVVTLICIVHSVMTIALICI